MKWLWLAIPVAGLVFLKKNDWMGQLTAIELIKKLEGFSHTPYEDEAGNMTIGYGHKILPFEKFDWISKEEAEQILRRDIAIAEKAINNNVKVPLSPAQYAALLSFVFNVGTGAFAGTETRKPSTLLTMLNEGDYLGAANQLKRWVYVTINGNKIVSTILTRRRNHEYDLFVG